MKKINSLILSLVFITSCSGQNKTQSGKIANEPKVITVGQLKMIKTQGTDQYQNVHCGLLDKEGNLWFGTTGEGVYRYDGKSFTNFTAKDGLSDNTVWSILEDKIGNIWFGTDDGVCRYDGKTITRIPIAATNANKFYLFNSQNNNPSAKNAVWSILQDKSGQILFGTSDGVYCYSGKFFTRFLDNTSIINKSGLHLKNIQCIFEDKNANIWFGSGFSENEGVCCYDGKSLTNFRPNGDGWVRSILEDKNGSLWFGCRSRGVCRYDGKTFTPFTEKEGIGNPILKDKAGNIWFSGGEKENGLEGEGGIWCYNGKSFKNLTPIDGLLDYSVWSMVEDRSGNIWVGSRGMGLVRYDGKIFTDFTGKDPKQ